MANQTKPEFDKQIFWDVDFEKIDYETNANWVIVRVFERGDVPDIRHCRKYYGDEKIKEALLNAKFLMLKTLYLASAIIEKPIFEFKCYKSRQLNPELFPY